MNVAQRSKKLKSKLLKLRIGPGAAIFPKEITRIHLEFAYRLEGGHFGPRKFWRQCMPSLKYYNPAVSMTVNRLRDQEDSATLSVYTNPSLSSDIGKTSNLTSSTPNQSVYPSDHRPSETVNTISIKHKNETDILSELLHMTKAQRYETTAYDIEQLKEIKDFEARSQSDRRQQTSLNRKRDEEKAMLEKARGAVS